MNFEFCPNCGGHRTVEEVNSTKYACTACTYVFWNNPKAATAVIFVRGNNALYAKRAIEPNKGMYDFPGGFIEHGEDPYIAAAREIKEETGLTVKTSDLHLLTAYTSQYLPDTSAVDLVFHILKWEGDPEASDDVSALEWKPLSFIYNENFTGHYNDLEEKIRSFTGI